MKKIKIDMFQEYVSKLIFRCCVFLVVLLAYLFEPDYFDLILTKKVEMQWLLSGLSSEQIRQMQELIREIVAKTMSAQAEEARNKQLIEKKFASVKKQIREVKSSQKAVNTYYQNMMKNAYLDSQFLDRKK
mgnify:CR=1 FL=1